MSIKKIIPSTDYDGLKIQFNALKSLCLSLETQISIYNANLAKYKDDIKQSVELLEKNSDTERMDWLEKHIKSISVSLNPQMDGKNISGSFGRNNNIRINASSVRELISLAMQE